MRALLIPLVGILVAAAIAQIRLIIEEWQESQREKKRKKRGD